MKTPPTSPQTASTKRTPEDGMNNSATSSNSPIRIKAYARINISCMGAGPAKAGRFVLEGLYLFYDDPVAFNLDDLDPRAGMHVAALGHDVDVLVAEARFPRRAQRSRRFADG